MKYVQLFKGKMSGNIKDTLITTSNMKKRKSLKKKFKASKMRLFTKQHTEPQSTYEINNEGGLQMTVVFLKIILQSKR